MDALIHIFVILGLGALTIVWGLLRLQAGGHGGCGGGGSCGSCNGGEGCGKEP